MNEFQKRKDEKEEAIRLEKENEELKRHLQDKMKSKIVEYIGKNKE